jgi:eukaryotic-like serine/threonine-protein kinase
VLLNELRTLTRLAHPGVCALEGAFLEPDGHHAYLQMPLAEGGALPAWLQSAPRSLSDRLRVFRGVVEAVAYLHARRIVHRDLKPSNVLLRSDGSPLVADFGIAMDLDSALVTVLRSTVLGGGGFGGGGGGGGIGPGAGTAAYKSPEQLRGERPGPTADVYALGLLLHELLWGRPYALPLEARAALGAPGGGGGGDAADDATAPLLPAAADAPPDVVPPASRHVAEAATSLLRRLLAPSAGDRPLSAAVLADPLCDPSLWASAAAAAVAPLTAPGAVGPGAAAGGGGPQAQPPGQQQHARRTSGGSGGGGAAQTAAAPTAAPGAGATDTNAAITAARRELAPLLQAATRTAATVRLNAALVPTLTPVLCTAVAAAGSAAGFASAPWRIVLSVSDITAAAPAPTAPAAAATATVDTERALDAFLMAAVRVPRAAAAEGDGGAGGAAATAAAAAAAVAGSGTFESAGSRDDNSTGTSLLPCPGGDANVLAAAGAVLAQAALQGASLDVVQRLHPLTADVLLRGPSAVVTALGADVGRAVAHLGAWDPQLAASYRTLLVSPGAADLGIDLPGWRGVDAALNDANKEDAVRRSCVEVLVGRRLGAWEALWRGWLAAGGAAVSAAVSAAGAGGGGLTALTLSPLALAYDPGAVERRARAAVDDAASSAHIATNTRPCPRCGVRVEKNGGCDHMTCRCGMHWSWLGGTPYPGF